MASKDLLRHHLKYIQWSSKRHLIGITRLTFKFSNGQYSPEKGSYEFEPDEKNFIFKKTAVHHIQKMMLQMTRFSSRNTYLTGIKVQSRELIEVLKGLTEEERKTCNKARIMNDISLEAHSEETKASVSK